MPDIESTDLDIAAVEHGSARPRMKDRAGRRAQGTGPAANHHKWPNRAGRKALIPDR
jgi:hypothetical protein